MRASIKWEVYVEELMTVEETAVRLGLSKVTIYKYVARNKIPYYRISNRLRFSRREIDEWLLTFAHNPKEAS